MDLQRLISAMVRQTTVLIARLSTSGGTRSPLAQVADQVFVGLVTELERQGLGKKVAADMFGLALRSYQLKVQRLQESASEVGVTLWSALRSFIEAKGAVSRAEVLRRFSRDDEESVRGILADLVDSGLCSRTGRGDGTIYRITPRDDLSELVRGDDGDACAALVWLTVCRDGPLSRQEIADLTGLSASALESALATLLADSRIGQSVTTQGETFSGQRCLIPVGDAAGWEASLLDHYQAVLNAIAAKICAGAHSSAAKDETGGSTFSFELWPGHPDEARVRGLLARLRADAAEIWARVSEYNAESRHGEQGRYNVTFYLGQCLRRDDHLDEES